MEKQVLKDSHNHQIGTIKINGTKKELYDEHNHYLGCFDGKQTKDEHNHIIGTGDLLTTLLRP